MPVLPPTPLVVRVPADAPYPSVEAMAAEPRVRVVLDLAGGPLKRGRVELLRAGRIDAGVRIHAEPDAALVRLLRRLGPLPLLEVAPRDVDAKALASLSAALRGVSARRRRVVLPTAPSAQQLAAVASMRDVALRFPWPADEPTRADVFASLERFPGLAEFVLPEELSLAALRAVRPSQRVVWVLRPSGSSYLADATVEAVLALRGTRHVVETAHAVRPVDVAQMARLPGLRIELLRPGAHADALGLVGLGGMLRALGR